MARRLLWIVGAFVLLVNSAYLAAFASPSLFYFANVVLHMALGVAGIALARTAANARTYLLVGGAAYLVLFIYGLAIDRGTQWNFAALNNADNWLHLILAIAMIGLGSALPRRVDAERRYTATA